MMEAGGYDALKRMADRRNRVPTELRITFILSSPIPVSYTHLDVYKRQVSRTEEDTLQMYHTNNKVTNNHAFIGN